MSRSVVLTFALMFAFLLGACSQEPSKEPAAEAPATQIREGAKEMAEGAEKVAEGAAEATEQAAEKAAETGAAVKETAVDAMETAAAKTESTAKEVATAVSEAAAEVKQDVAAAIEAPATVTFEASKGLVTFHHAEHAQRHECQACHTTDPPQKIVFASMSEAHALCRDCHRAQGGDAPTACNGCHQP